MEETLLNRLSPETGEKTPSLRMLLERLRTPFAAGQRVGIKLHWGERGNHSFLPPSLAREVVLWLKEMGVSPFVFDTTVLYSGGRRTATDSLRTAADHGFQAEFLGCPVIMADGSNGREVVTIPAGFKHFSTVQVTSLVNDSAGFVIFSHFKGHQVAGFGGALKNISMGFASRSQKQRIHSDVVPELKPAKCSRCGDCVICCPTGAARFADDGYPAYNRELCAGCAQCIAHCPEMALATLWREDLMVFQEKLVETAAAIWRVISDRAVLINALVNITSECDCLAGKHPIIAPDIGFVGGYNPLAVDRKSLEIVGTAPFEKVHPDVPWQRQFAYAEEIGFGNSGTPY